MTSRLKAFENAYEPKSVEERIRLGWEEHKFYEVKRDPSKKPYVIVIPPPNVTSDLHVGHMLNNTLQDFLIRWNRANGKNACWIPGTDHASIATEAKVTQHLAKQGILKRNISREEFLKHAWTWKEDVEARIIKALKTLGISCDWSRYEFTMTPEYYDSVIKAFVKLYKDGLVYRGKRLVNWCPFSQSVISDEEVYHEEKNGSLWHIRYPVEGTSEYVVVATTRPETLFGDLAVAVHPEDERYKHLVGKKVKVPATGRSVPIIADSYVEKEFGTGALKITPAHDMNDYQVGERHNLGLLNVMNPDATLNENVPAEYRGLDRFVARKKVVAQLEAEGLLDKIVPHKNMVGMSERGRVPIEFYLSDQWYIKMEPLAKLALEATSSGKLKLVPEHTIRTWDHWLKNIRDWCVSRQLYWGHRIPIYTCDSCKHLMCEEKAPLTCDKCGGAKLTQDPDVLDTWASSWLWPFAVHNWAHPSEEEKKDLEYFYPTDVIVTGTDIIFFWIARMVMAGKYFLKKEPFHTVYFSGLVRDEQGRKVSKSLGNYTDLFEMIDKWGTDALRFSLVNQLVTGSDINWDLDSCEIGKTFANKLWNVTRFLLMYCEQYGVEPSKVDFESLKVDANDPVARWVTSEFYQTVEACHKTAEAYEFAAYSKSLYEFSWLTFCDWFIELIKPRLFDADKATAEEKVAAKKALELGLSILDGTLRLLHPVIPYITEEIWQKLGDGRESKTIGFLKIPAPNAKSIDAASIARMREVQGIVSSIRNIRGIYQIHPRTELKVTLYAASTEFGDLVKMMETLAKANFIFDPTLKNKPSFSAATIASGKQLFVDLEGIVDPAKERERLMKEIAKLEKAAKPLEAKLSRPDFVKGAPEAVIAGVKAELEKFNNERALLQASLKTLPGAGG